MSEMTQVLGTVAMEPKGEWNSGTYYEKLNTVLYNDSTYMAKEGVVGENPSTSSKWQLIGGGIKKEDIINNLESTAIDKPLSANQGRVLNESIFIDNISATKMHDDTSNTDYYITEIPLYNENGNMNAWELGLPYDDETLASSESTIDFAISKNASICINGGIGSSNNVKKPHGVLIKDGVILKDELFSTYPCKILGIKNDGSFMTFDAATTSAQTVLDAGCINALVGWDSFIENGQSVTYSPGNGVETHPRQVIARKTNGDYLIFTCDGREEDNIGMTIADVQRILLARGDIDFAYNLDGGGSASTIVDLQKINKNIDEHYQDRQVYSFLYIAKNTNKKEIKKIYALVSELRQEVIKNKALGEVLNGTLKLFDENTNPCIEFYDNEKLTDYNGFLRINKLGLTAQYRENGEGELKYLLTATNTYLRYLGEAFGKWYNYASNNGNLEIDLNTLEYAGVYYANTAGGSTNTPTTGGFIVFHIPSYEYSQIKFQIAIPIADNNEYIYIRRSVSNTFQTWQALTGFKSGATSGRPTTNLKIGMIYFDTTTHKPIWYGGGGVWYDATGAQV